MENIIWRLHPGHIIQGDKNTVYYLFHLFGDAFTTIYTNQPQYLTVTHDPVIVSGQPQFNITADNNSLIALTMNGEIVAVGEGTGTPVSIDIPFIIPGNTVTLTVTKQNYYRFTAQIPVVPASGPYVVADSCIINDASGNSNGILDYGESPLLSLRANNVGVAQAENVTLVLRSNDANVTITDSTEYYGSIPAGGQILVTDGYAIEVNPLVPDEHNITFEVVATDGINNWLSYFSLKAHSPELVLSDYTVSDPTGNNNGILDPGETADILIEITNDGTSGALNVSGELISIDPYILVNSSTEIYGSISARWN